MLTLSLIIPVYNEERHIRACLEAVKKQTIMPDEVLVIDNNCTDETVKIAQSYSFVTVIKEKRPGLIPARNNGFSKAKGQILGRIDADSVLDEKWVETVSNQFEQDAKLAGLTGLAVTSITPFTNFFDSTILSRCYFWWINARFNTVTMWGANMAIRKSAWDSVANQVSQNDIDVHEDQDLSLWIAASGGEIRQENSMLIKTSGQTYRYFPKLIYYTKLHLKTKQMHKQNGNLSSPKLRTIGYYESLWGRIFSILPIFYLYGGSLLLFPLDYFFIHILKRKYWL